MARADGGVHARHADVGGRPLDDEKRDTGGVRQRHRRGTAGALTALLAGCAKRANQIGERVGAVPDRNRIGAEARSMMLDELTTLIDRMLVAEARTPPPQSASGSSQLCRLALLNEPG